jgi:uncharacterized protein (TIGR03435 family)
VLRLPVLVAVAVAGLAAMNAQSRSPFPPEQRGDLNARFEAAWVKENPLSRREAGHPAMRMLPSGEFQAGQETVRQLIAFSYEVDDYQIVDAPGWTADKLFDIAAQAPDHFEMRQVRPMVRNLLADRFALIVRKEPRSMPTYSLEWNDRTHTPGRGIRPAPRCNDATAPTPRTPWERSCEHAYGWEGDGLFGRQASMKDLTRLLTTVLHRPVIDKTGLRGLYDFDIRKADPIFTAIREQLGLKLTAADDQVDAVVIKRVERPTPN